jgi:uncharacterized protein YqgC (DUF456 family)
MAKLIGTLIGIIFGAGIVLGPLFGSYYFGRNLYYAFAESTRENAKIVECTALKTRKSSTVNRSWAPVAKTDEGVVAKGIFGVKKKADCTVLVGTNVGIFVHKSDPSKNQINSFFQLWFYPLCFGFITLVLYGAMANNLMKKRRSKWKSY